MRHISLSDYTRSRLEEREKEREERYLAAVAKQMCDVRRKEEDKAENRVAMQEAWRDRKLLGVLKHLLRLFVLNTSADAPHPVKESPDEEDCKLESGKEGEQRVRKYLEERLSDEWTLLTGYRNRKGEIDGILVGPEGIFAMEIKNTKGQVFCSGDKWWRDRYDNYGNLVEAEIPIEDGGKRKRGPSLQLNEPAEELQKFLGRDFPSCRICRIVIFAHDRASLGTLENATVDEVVVLSDWCLEDTIKRSSFCMIKPEVERMLKKIEKDHRFMDRILRRHKEGSREAA